MKTNENQQIPMNERFAFDDICIYPGVGDFEYIKNFTDNTDTISKPRHPIFIPSINNVDSTSLPSAGLVPRSSNTIVQETTPSNQV